MDERETGPWQGRVRFGPGGGFAYRPGEILVRSEIADFAEERLRHWASERMSGKDEAIEVRRDEGFVAQAFARFTGTFEVPAAIEELARRGVSAQVNHVLFASVCCPPHPSDPAAEEFYANPFYANPFYANPFYANPFYANAGGGCGCPRDCCGCTSANPFYANPFYANPFYANPFYANAGSPFADPAKQHSGSRSSSARPAPSPTQAAAQAVNGIRVAILDTGWAETNAPTGLVGISVTASGGDRPDEDGDGFLDPASGHGTFIAGIIEQHAPGCELEVIEVLSTYGDGDEAEIAQVLGDLAARPDDDRPHIVNLSFGGYSPIGMAALAAAISRLQEAGTLVVASAGNDATCIPMYPAALPGVIGVGAIDQAGKPAAFTNYGPWVRACAPGVDIVSIFFEGFDGAGPMENNYDPDRFEGWARWMGTSFAAPRVVAELARELGGGANPEDAVKDLIDNSNGSHRPMLGAVVGWDEANP